MVEYLKYQNIDWETEVAYVDIQSNGLRVLIGSKFFITTITLFDGQKYKHYVKGINLHEFKEDIKPFKAVVTWYGTIFDLPQITKNFQLAIDWTKYVHFDLFYLFKNYQPKKYTSYGLKFIKNMRNIQTFALKEINGKTIPIDLWEMYSKGDNKALQLLLAYNTDDTICLKYLFRYIYFFIKNRNESISQQDNIISLSLLTKTKLQCTQLMNKCMKELKINEEIVYRYLGMIQTKQPLDEIYGDKLVKKVKIQQ